ncbi:monocyte chemotactic protein 1B-like [Halichoeres trimaculatus]|uniref:monocyte chemotactic protein 1B-like n=1 Tax=Halichoeres trimaculatus TaxID=147232 RepID=UPI003D9DD2A7
MPSLNLTVLLFLVTIVVSTASGQGEIGRCCRSLTTTQVHRDRLKSYYIQYRCPLRAVVFTTVYGKRICSSPSRVWTKTSMAYLDGKNWQLNNLSCHAITAIFTLKNCTIN